ncbi:MAG: hypothetical protein ACREEH_04355 [Caulobacteraceae bacterium]
MTHWRDRAAVAPRPGPFALIFVVAILAAIFVHFQGPGLPDWDGYDSLYFNRGGWLADEGRDPAFVWFIDHAGAVFGGMGYDAFRKVTFAVFGLVAAWLASITPRQDRLGDFSWLFVAVAILSALLLKSLVQIREGLAFLCILVPMAWMLRRPRAGGVFSAIGSALGGAVHAGAAMFGGVWLGAFFLIALRDQALQGRWLRNALLIFGVSCGLAAALFVRAHPWFDTQLLQDLGVDSSADVQTGLWKEAYWLLNGVITAILVHHIALEGRGRRFTLAWLLTLGWALLPGLYTACVVLTFSHFELPTVTTFFVRAYFTVSELAILAIAFQGTAAKACLFAALAMLAERARIFEIALTIQSGHGW